MVAITQNPFRRRYLHNITIILQTKATKMMIGLTKPSQDQVQYVRGGLMVELSTEIVD